MVYHSGNVFTNKEITYRDDDQKPRVVGSIILLEHQPVYTLGRGSKEEFVLDKSIEAVRVERGGEVTYHGPGQLVGYLIFDLEYFKKDLHWMVRSVEEAIIQFTGYYDVGSHRVPGKTGIWVGNEKLAAIGIGVKQWVTMHGFAVNIHSHSLEGFKGIVPCGIATESGGVTSLDLQAKKGVDKSLLDFRHSAEMIDKSLRPVFDLEYYNPQSHSMECDWALKMSEGLDKLTE
jgi:lipoyl(octanoyl) transferase